MNQTIQKSSSGATFTVTDKNGAAQSYAANTYLPYLYPNNTNLTLYSVANPCFDAFGVPASGIIINQPFGNIINGDTSLAFASLAALNTYILTNFFDLAGGPGGGLSASNFIIEVPTGAINGSNTNFTLSNTPKVILGWIQNNLILYPTTDYSFSGNAVTMVNAPINPNQLGVSDTLLAIYIK